MQNRYRGRCPRCGKWFVSYRSRKQIPTHCSRYCATRVLLRKFKKTCPTCAKDFVATTYRDGRRIRKRTVFCSKRCRALGWSVRAKKLKPVDAAYIAAFVDGEGSIVPMRRADGSVKSFRLAIANTHFGSLYWCQKVVGIGSVVQGTRRELRYKPIGYYCVYGVKGVSLLRQILPYMKIKADLARGVIEMMKP